MPQESGSGISKVTILAFKDKTYQKRVEEKFEMPINPKDSAMKLKPVYGKSQVIGSQGNDPDYKSTSSETLTLTFTLDGTGVIPIEGKPNQFHTDVSEQLNLFHRVAYCMNSNTHRPNFLRLIWGHLEFGDRNCFDCVLDDLNIQYTLLSPTGKPLRALLTATFLSYIEPRKRIREEGKNSPDVTHIRTVKAEDTLPLMTEKIYGDQSYYLQVAKANGLINFRRLKTSTTLRFPCLDKTIP